MTEQRLAILGIGNPRCGMPIVGALANYFGERPLEIRFFDSDPEFLEMYDKLARIAFKYSKSPHRLISTEDPAEALEEADLVVYQMSERSDRKFVKRHGSAVDPPANPAQFTADELLKQVPAGAKVLSLAEQTIQYPMGIYKSKTWPEPLSDNEMPLVLHQVLRYLADDEPIFHLLQAYEKTPFAAWIEDPSTAEFVSKS